MLSGTLEGLNHKPNYEKLLENPLLRFSGLYLEQCPPLMVRLQLFNNGEALGLPVTTSYKAFTKRYKYELRTNVFFLAFKVFRYNFY